MNNSDYVFDVVKLIRNAKTDEEGKKVLLENFRVLLLDESIMLIVEDTKVEKPIDDYFIKKNLEVDESNFLNNIYSKDMNLVKKKIKKYHK